MITRKLDKDDAQAGFTYTWVKKFGQNLDELKVICLEKGNLEGLGQNVQVFSMGKEKGKNRLREFINFQRGAIKFIKKVDGVFCHQNPEYTLLIAPYAKIFRKKIIAWYSHKEINFQVKLMNFLANQVTTPTPEGFGLKSKKKIVLGHGIDIDLFKPLEHKKPSPIFRIISVGRISPIKDYKTLIEAIEIIQKEILLKVQIIGGPGLNHQREHLYELKKMVKEKNLEELIEFKGLIPNQELSRYYQEADLSINLCPTGSPDKAVLESMASGLMVLVCNKTFKDDFGVYHKKLIFQEKNPEDLALKIVNLAHSKEKKEIQEYLRARVDNLHNLNNLVLKIINLF